MRSIFKRRARSIKQEGLWLMAYCLSAVAMAKAGLLPRTEFARG